MFSILKSLYEGELHPCEGRFPDDPGYKKAITEASDIREKLQSKLTEDDYAMFENLFNVLIKKETYESFYQFKDGFCIGMLIMLEVLDEWQTSRGSE